ncbi:MAG: hypothetical protein AB8D78_15645 [Akkermansiaceae bacterium]
MQIVKFVASAGIALVACTAYGQEKMPRENVIEFPAVGKGLCVSNLFQSNMVIQRDKPVTLWGWAAPGENVTVSFAGISESATAAKDRTWKVSLPAMSASSDPLTLTVKGKSETLTLENILIGDVWILGGQSNMEFPLSKVENGNLEIISANFPEMRILTVPKVISPEKQPGFARLHEWSSWSSRHFRKGDWDVLSPEIARELSAIGYVFARRLHMTTQVPIGVVDISLGGTTVEAWTPESEIRKIDTQPVKNLLATWDEKVAAFDPQEDLKNRITKHEQWVERMEKAGKPANRKAPTEVVPGPAFDQNRPGNCYAGMIGQLEGYAVKGAIFHQGYNNCFNGTEGAEMYRDVFPTMIAAWRAAFNDPEMPFGILSLCSAGERQSLVNFTEHMGDVGARIREAQYQTYLELLEGGDENIGFVSTYDLRRSWYHPQLKLPAGERIARWALATEYGFEKDVKWKPPIVKEMTKEEGKIVLSFDQAISAVADGGPIEGFAIAGEDRMFYPATAENLVIGKDDRNRDKKDNKKLVLTNPLVPNPVHYRYAWGRSPMGNLQLGGFSDVPLATQRSDDWPIEEVFVDGELTEMDGRKIKGLLRKANEERLLKEAQHFIETNTQK